MGCGAVEDNQAIDAAPIQDDTPPEPMRVTLAQLRALPDGPVNVILEPSRITYVRAGRNFHIQADAPGPATSVFTAATGTPPGVIGNTIEIHVTELATFDGNKQIMTTAAVDNDNIVASVSDLAQTLTVVPSEDLESELVKIERGTVTAVQPPNTFTVQLTNGTLVKLFSPVGSQVGLCQGATFDLLAPVIEFQGAHEVTSTVMTDFTNVNVQACP